VPYARWLLARLRDRSTSSEEFRRYMREAGRLLAIYSSREPGCRRIAALNYVKGLRLAG